MSSFSWWVYWWPVRARKAESEGWVSLGTFAFDAGALQYVELTDAASPSGDLESGPLVVFDASALPDSPPQPRCMLLILGDSREDVGRRWEGLRGEGFEL